MYARLLLSLTPSLPVERCHLDSSHPTAPRQGLGGMSQMGVLTVYDQHQSSGVMSSFGTGLGLGSGSGLGLGIGVGESTQIASAPAAAAAIELLHLARQSFRPHEVNEILALVIGITKSKGEPLPGRSRYLDMRSHLLTALIPPLDIFAFGVGIVDHPLLTATPDPGPNPASSVSATDNRNNAGWNINPNRSPNPTSNTSLSLASQSRQRGGGLGFGSGLGLGLGLGSQVTIRTTQDHDRTSFGGDTTGGSGGGIDNRDVSSYLHGSDVLRLQSLHWLLVDSYYTPEALTQAIDVLSSFLLDQSGGTGRSTSRLPSGGSLRDGHVLIRLHAVLKRSLPYDILVTGIEKVHSRRIQLLAHAEEEALQWRDRADRLPAYNQHHNHSIHPSDHTSSGESNFFHLEANRILADAGNIYDPL